MVKRFDVSALPVDHESAVLAGRVSIKGDPRPVIVRAGQVFDVSGQVDTISDLLDLGDPAGVSGRDICGVGELTVGGGDYALLSPIDLQCVKACGVTFAVSAIERVIEERARGNAEHAADIRANLEDRVGSGIRNVTPGTNSAAELKAALIDADMWSQYLEVAIGPDAEVFTKAPVLSTVGWGAAVGIRSDSSWNNPEPEVVLAVNASGKPVGAMLGNDVNLRDFEGRSALLLGKAKDNNAACALGPFIRLFGGDFSMDDVRSAELDLQVEGLDGYRLEGHSSMKEISRDPLELVRQTLSEHHYPDGFVLMLGTLFAPVQDRNEPGRGFTHNVGDTVHIHSARLGTLTNEVVHSCDAPAWEFGIREFYRSIRQRHAVAAA
ncbi:fumarylacetoacetate hydrolase [Altererythrobacter sp. FM1]|uniref:fumarylacetoacetate hydrolase family protein n=1 Tax=Tsuneonella flava TaxID=2055955 RepID=UPI000C808BF5|nr:fumarylacetoacetate hydrolase family protein [Tsuneonella flava]ROT97509.1 fumarylacetoacetate hydrolase [Altererythrobacter sp. FM1]